MAQHLILLKLFWRTAVPYQFNSIQLKLQAKKYYNTITFTDTLITLKNPQQLANI